MSPIVLLSIELVQILEHVSVRWGGYIIWIKPFQTAMMGFGPGDALETPPALCEGGITGCSLTRCLTEPNVKASEGASPNDRIREGSRKDLDG